MFPLLKNDKKSAFWREYDKGYYGNYDLLQEFESFRLNLKVDRYLKEVKYMKKLKIEGLIFKDRNN